MGARISTTSYTCMNIELPNDWGVTKRQNHLQQPLKSEHNTSSSTSDGHCNNNEDELVCLDRTKKKEGEEDPPPPPNCNSNEKTGGSGSSAKKRKKNQSAGEEEEEEGGENLAKKISNDLLRIEAKGPLGPRGVFNAVTHDTPEKGQLKQVVMMKLQAEPSAEDGSRHRNAANEGKKKKPSEEDDTDGLQMEVHCLLSKLPYQKMLSDLFSHHDRELLPNPNIPYVTRAYEESFMREQLNSTERLCAKGEQCECMFIEVENPFVCIEFLLPGEKQPPTPHLCVVCCRAITQQLYYDIMFDKHDFGGVIQRFGNIHSQPGEYALDSMLIAAPTVPLHIMPLPIVSHQRNRYFVYNKRGIKHLKQARVYFQSTPSC